MSFVTKRNALISALHKAVGVPVLLASQVQPDRAGLGWDGP